MTSLYNAQQNYYKKMLDLQEKLRKSEEERIRLEERYKLLVQDSRNRHQTCINKLRIRYLEFLEDQRTRDQRNNSLLITLNKIDGSLAFMSAKTERLSTLRKQYESYLLRTYGRPGPSGSVTADSGLESQHEQEISNPSPVSSKPNEFSMMKSSPLFNTNRDLVYPNFGATNFVEQQNENFMNLIPALPARRNPVIEPQKSLDLSWLSEKSRDVLKNRPVVPNPSFSSPTSLSFDALNDERIKDKFLNLSLKSSSPVVGGGLQDLDRYLGNIKKLQADSNFTRSFENDDQPSLAEADHEQNTSGDILNVSLSEDGLETPEVPKHSKLERKATFQLRRRNSIFEKSSDEEPAVEKEAEENDDIGSSKFLQAVEQYQFASLKEPRRLIEQNHRLLSSTDHASIEEDRAIEAAPHQSTYDLETTKNDSANYFEEEDDDADDNERDEDEDEEGGEGDGIEDDYDETVDIDSWHPPEEEETAEEPEPRQPNRIRRTLESIEEVEQLEDDEDAPVAEQPPIVPTTTVEVQPQEPLQETLVDEKQEEYPQSDQYTVEPDETGETQEQYDYQAQPTDEQYQYQYPGYEDQQYAYDYTSEQYQQQPYDQQYYQPEQQDYDQAEAQVYDESGYALGTDYQTYPESETVPEQPYDYNLQEQSYTVDLPDDDPSLKEPAATPAPAPITSTVDSQENKKKDVIKSILDSDSESFIERNLSNAESDFDFN